MPLCSFLTVLLAPRHSAAADEQAWAPTAVLPIAMPGYSAGAGCIASLAIAAILLSCVGGVRWRVDSKRKRQGGGRGRGRELRERRVVCTGLGITTSSCDAGWTQGRV
ncbi:hypothetical protein GQ54DRAFT_50836 [Martensiomyces pterosporus]|nr:hypothetical protein GQ54DRAFT_50836 [Martensiomyces pterosporus]